MVECSGIIRQCDFNLKPEATIEEASDKENEETPPHVKTSRMQKKSKGRRQPPSASSVFRSMRKCNRNRRYSENEADNLCRRSRKRVSAPHDDSLTSTMSDGELDGVKPRSYRVR